jgi:hypothetical protein
MGKHLVLVDGGHTHMTALLHLGDFIIKDDIDRRFMRKFQVSGELTDTQ